MVDYSQGTVRKAAGWDFPDRSEGTGTVRGGLRPPQITSTKEGRFDNSSTLKRTADRENQWRMVNSDFNHGFLSERPICKGGWNCGVTLSKSISGLPSRS